MLGDARVALELSIHPPHCRFDHRIHADMDVACHRVAHFIHFDHSLQKIFDTPAGSSYRRSDWHAQHLAKGVMV